MRRALLVALALALALSACGSATRLRRPRVSHDFLGLVSNDALSAAPVEQARILTAERSAGASLLRVTFDWASIEPRRGVWDFARYDALMAASARAGLDVLPVLFGAPAWAAAPPVRGARVSATTAFPPKRAADYAAFASRLAQRYGPGGSFWRAHRLLHARAISDWQLWNEPNLAVYWGGAPDAGAYARLLGAAQRALLRVDSHAQVLTAGLAQGTHGIAVLTYLRELLAAGARDSFATLALNLYAPSAADVIDDLRSVRSVLDQDGLPTAGLWLTEFGWASGGPQSSFTLGQAGQARELRSTIVRLARSATSLRLRAVVYFDWRDGAPYRGVSDFWGLHTGLLERNGAGKLALAAFRRAAALIG